jgi:ATP-binding cassette subfamily B protein
VLLDGVDVRSFVTEDVRALIGVVPQQVYLFNGTIRDNLLVADGDAADATILDECERSGLGAFLGSLPRGSTRSWGTTG